MFQRPPRLRSVLTLALGLALLVAAAGNAAIYTLTPTGTLANWSDTTQWNNGSGSSYPGQSPGDVVTVSLNNITLNVDAPLANPVQVNISGSGDLSTTSTLTLSGSSTWSGGTIVGAGGLKVGTGATLNLNGSGAVLDGTTLTNNGTITLTSASANALKLAGAGKISNNGTFDVQSDGGVTSDATSTAFNSNINATLKKSGGTGTTTISVHVVSLGALLANVGTLAFTDFSQFAPGSTQLNGGNLQGSTLWYRGGKILGGGKIDANVELVTVTLEPGRGVAPATLNITGNVNQSGGVLIVDCFAHEVTDKYVIGGVAGIEVVRPLWIGGYDPANGDRFDDVITGTGFPSTVYYNYFPFGHNGTGSLRQTISPTSISYSATVPTDDVGVSEAVGTNAPLTTTYPVTVTVRNLGTYYASGVQVALSASNGSIVSTTSTAFSCSGSGPSAACTMLPSVSIAPDATATITVNVDVPSGSGSLTSSVTANMLDPNPANDTATATVPGAVTADLGLTLSDSPDPVSAGRIATYTYTVTNAGPAASTATLSAVIGTGPTNGADKATISGVGAGCVQATSTLATCTSASIAAGGSATFTIAVTAPPSAGIIASGSVAPPAGVADPNLSNNTASQTTAVTPLADVSITMHAPANARPGGTITYTLEVVNLGPSDAGLSLNDPTPPGLTLVKFTDGPCYVYPCNLTPLPAGSSRTIVAVYNIAANLSGTINNTASLTALTPDPSLGNNTAHVLTTLSTTCPAAGSPVPAVVASAISGQTYDLQWPAVDDATQYEIDEAADENFTNPATRSVTTTVVSFTHATQSSAETFYYRVRAFSPCAQQFGNYSQTVHVTIVPPARRRAVRR